MSKQIVRTEHAPAAVGAYSQGIIANGFVFTAGQIPLDPKTGKLVEGSIEDMTRQSLENVKGVLEAAGSNLSLVVKTTVFLQDMGDFAAMNSVYAQYFTENPPARSAVEVVALPLGAQVEIEAVALLQET